MKLGGGTEIHVGASLKPDLPYMTVGELNEFAQLRRLGAVTFFRVALCWASKGNGACGKEIARHKQLCGRKCYEAALKAIGDEPDERQTILLEYAKTETKTKRGSDNEEGDEYDEW